MQIQCLLILHSFLFRKCLFSFQCSQTYSVLFQTELYKILTSRLKTAGQKPVIWLTGASGDKHKTRQLSNRFSLTFYIEVHR